MGIYINRTLNMKKIKAIGLDMDYTLVRYNSKNFEKLSHFESLKKLVELKNYPPEIQNLPFQFDLVIQGLVIDKKHGNLLQLSRYGKVKIAHHGTHPLNYQEVQNIYGNKVIDLNHPMIQSLDTNFSVSNGIMFEQLVDLKEQGLAIPDYATLADDIKSAIDICHSDGTLKGQVHSDISSYIIQDPEVVTLLEKYKSYGKKLLIITNSEFEYCKLLMEYTIDPFLKNHSSWRELFEITITMAKKPLYFNMATHYLKIDPDTGLMSNVNGPITSGVYQGGWAGKLQDDLGLKGEEILYLGDHIFGDVLSIKKTFNWRTALVLGPLEDEVASIKKSAPVQKEIDELMMKKESLELKLNKLDQFQDSAKAESAKEKKSRLYADLEKINLLISDLLESYRQHFNPYWGEIMRAGQEESRFADQVEKYACIYMTKVSDLLLYSPRTYFRPIKRIMPHEL